MDTRAHLIFVFDQSWFGPRFRRGLFVLGTAIGLIAGGAGSAETWAAEIRLRPLIEVDRATVTLDDLFENAGAVGPATAMAAPEPGERIELTLDRAFEIANSHGLGWRPVADFSRAIITRAWRYLDESAILRDLGDRIKTEHGFDKLDLNPKGIPPRIKIARGALVPYKLEDIRFDAKAATYSATLVIEGDRGNRRRTELRGSAVTYEQMPVLRHRLRSDSIVADADIAWAQIRTNKIPADAVRDPTTLIGTSPIRTTTPGRPLRQVDFGAAKIVTKGAMIAMHFDIGNLRLVTAGRAQESGSLDDTIRVQNVDSRRIVEARVIGAGRVSVRQGIATIGAQ